MHTENGTAGHENISYTADDVAYSRSLSDIPYCSEIAHIIGADEISPEKKELYRYFAPFFEGRYKAVTHLLEASGINHILELAAGMSPRGITMTHAPDSKILYTETDLPEKIRQKRVAIEELCRENNWQLPANLRFEELDVMNAPGFMELVNQFPEGPVAICNEGLMVYFTREEKQHVSDAILNVLKNRGGIWLTSDILTKEDLARNMPTAAIRDSTHEATKDTGRDYSDCAFEDLNDAETFFSDLGFQFEHRMFKDIISTFSTRNIGLDPAYTEDVLGGLVWTLRVK